MKLMMTADGISSPDAEAALLKLLNRDVADCRACIVTTASSAKEKSGTAVRTRQWLERHGFACADFVDIERDDPRLLSNYDVIYFNGGNPFYLLLWLKKSGAAAIVRDAAKRGAAIVGTSAGAMVLAPSLSHVNELNRIAGYEPMDIPELGGDYEALGLTELTPVPHYNRFVEANPRFEEMLQQLERTSAVRFQRIRDGEAVVIKS